MKTTGNTILITGGATGIGLEMARVLLADGNDVIICGRREAKLDEAKRELPALHTQVCDIGDPAQRQALLEWTLANFPKFNILVNNAGMQRMIDLTQGPDDLLSGDDEIAINLEAPIHLSTLFIPHLNRQPEAAIVNISSGLGFIPIASMPVYCATKAALHSFSLSLRHQLRNTRIKVFEVVPPTVDTELDRGARTQRGQVDRGIHPKEVAEATLKALRQDQDEVGVGQAQFLKQASREEAEKIFQRMNAH